MLDHTVATASVAIPVNEAAANVGAVKPSSSGGILSRLSRQVSKESQKSGNLFVYLLNFKMSDNANFIHVNFDFERQLTVLCATYSVRLFTVLVNMSL